MINIPLKYDIFVHIYHLTQFIKNLLSIKINYSSRTYNKSSDNIVLFSNEKFNITNLEKYLSKSEYSYIQDLLKTSDLKKNLFVFEVNSKKIVLVSIKNNLKSSDIENLGAEFYGRINYGKKILNTFVISDSIIGKQSNFLGHFLHGLKLKSYEFKNIYQKKKQELFQ